MYHSISGTTGSLEQYCVPPAVLREQLGALAAAGYELVGLTEALRRRGEGDGTPLVAVTFDDGYRDFATEALDVLADVGARATLYMAVGHAGELSTWNGADAHLLGTLLPLSELPDLAAAGVEIGSHSWRHHPLDTVDREDLRREVRASADVLEDVLGTRVTSFCYPHGYHDRAVRDVVAAAGFDNACEVGRSRYRGAAARGADVFAVPRWQPLPGHDGAAVVELARTAQVPLAARARRAAQPVWREVRRASARLGRPLT